MIIIGCKSERSQNITKEQSTAYEHAIATFRKIKPTEANDLLKKNSTAYLYFGRATCPECRTFAPKLRKISEKKQQVIYYIDTEKTEENSSIKKLRDELNIEFVPTLISLKHSTNNYFLYDDKKMSLTEFFEKK
ncbi:hypothetical protein RV15_GL000781 [Enterococcus silesiacus]|uniref:Thioredoxin domain-containing protein n=1 Tax=Enterococcus silesiacus TaxID=332949 RepID=A0AA91G9G8_9ENTE|nr:hypothetical protein RV15_GL000781 [Enterococcus silesiacus]